MLGVIVLVGAAAAAAVYVELAGWRALYGVALSLEEVWGRAFLAGVARTAAVALGLGAAVPLVVHLVPAAQRRLGHRRLALWALGTGLVLLVLSAPALLGA